VLANSYKYSFNFFEMTSTWCHWNAFSAIPSKFSRSVHLHIALINLSNCRVYVRLYSAWIMTSEQPQTLIQLTIRCGRQCTSVFAIRTSTALVNWSWCNVDQDTRLLRYCVKGAKYMFVRKTVIFWSHHMNHHMNSLIITIYGLSHVTSLLKLCVPFFR